jgi:voltage-gated sodium channel
VAGDFTIASIRSAAIQQGGMDPTGSAAERDTGVVGAHHDSSEIRDPTNLTAEHSGTVCDFQMLHTVTGDSEVAGQGILLLHSVHHEREAKSRTHLVKKELDENVKAVFDLPVDKEITRRKNCLNVDLPGPDRLCVTEQKLDGCVTRSPHNEETEDACTMSARLHQPMFWNPEDMKSQVRQSLVKPVYDVSSFYKRIGIWRTLATNCIFENTTLFVISVNAIWIAIDTDGNDASVLLEAKPIYQFAEHFFCTYFSFEWFVRFMAFRKLKFCFRDLWFVFDSALVFMMVSETWVMTVFFVIVGGSGSVVLGNAAILRLLRLLRLSRLARMLRSMPELMILIKGMVSAMRSLFFTMCLLFILIYVFAIALKQLASDTFPGERFFPTIPAAMHTLLLHGTFLDNLEVVCNLLGGKLVSPDPAMKPGSPVILLVFFVFVAMAALMVMNMLIGVLCEVVSAVASIEKEEMLVSFVRSRMQAVVQSLDENGDLMISKKEFAQILVSEPALVVLNEIGVDPVGLVDLSDFIFDDGDGNELQLSFSDFMEVIMEMRNSQCATVKDIMNLIKIVRGEMRKLEQRLCGLSRVRKTTYAAGWKVAIENVQLSEQESPPHRDKGVANDIDQDVMMHTMFSSDDIKEIVVCSRRASKKSSAHGDATVPSITQGDIDRRLIPANICSSSDGGLSVGTDTPPRHGAPAMGPPLRTETVEALLMAAHAEILKGFPDDAWADDLAVQLSGGLAELEKIRSQACQLLG